MSREPANDLRVLDAEVAEKVMGGAYWDIVIEGCSRNGFPFESRADAEAKREQLKHLYRVGEIVLHQDVPRYSSDISAAWEVVEKLKASGRFVQIDSFGFDGEEWRVCVRADSPEEFVAAEEATAPLAICKAALEAISQSTTSESPKTEVVESSLSQESMR